MGPTKKSIFRSFYELLFGSGLTIKPWHFQFLGAIYLKCWLRHKLGSLLGRGIDIGCGSQPYRPLMRNIESIIGLDIFPGEKVDLVVQKNSPWGVESASLDFCFSSQVICLIEKPDMFFSEAHRILKPGGHFVLIGPFIYNETSSFDRIRLSLLGIRELAEKNGFEVVEARALGAIGSSIGLLFLNWFYIWLTDSNFKKYILRILLLPVLPILNLLVNCLGLLLDLLDRSSRFYSSFGVVLKKKAME